MSRFMQRPTSPGANRRMVLLAAAVVSLASLAAQPAIADHDNDRGAHGDRGRESRDWRGDHDRSEHGDDRRRSAYRRYEVYPTDPVYYPRQASPGITLFFPFWDR